MPEIDSQVLQRFEAGLDPRHPQASAMPARVLGFGEISTVFEIDVDGARGWAFKRMPMFRDVQEAEAYARLHRRYVAALAQEAGLRVAPGEVVRVDNPSKSYVTLYIAQEKLAPATLGHRAIHRLPPGEVRRLVWATLGEMRKVFEFNARNKGRFELGLDGQISNWSVTGLEPEQEELSNPLELVYIDTSTPLMRVDGKEQLNPDLLLRSAPSFLLWLVRRAFLPEVMTRYYDFRRVATDLVANFYKEGRPELVPDLVETVNRFFAERESGAASRLTLKEVRDYYRFDALIWRVYLSLRKLDRVLAQVTGHEYPYILPEKISR